ncbi:hypothetical protein ERX46_01625 [Brumimicrobium glaciale]|uniref:TIR domain-containing protein n=1 Tax=Brumimicrobium glaciale TaxID=200475 RepID=A0A4Q4KSP3_9FLAO|nr:toll/interleukin-1 receptor domain-containing protein [Brumimicrobium glaciale]RYM35719.1 hypothetical protein ERX46_01625 [Brumimicrobium glaciale]
MEWNEIAEETILMFFDEKVNFELPKTKQKLAKELFSDIKLIQSLADFEQIIEQEETDQKFLFFVHLNHSKKNKGYDDFKASKIKLRYPNLRCYYISSVPKKTIFKDGNDSLDVFSYDNFHDKIGETFIPQISSEISSQEKSEEIFRKGIFLSHSSKDSELVRKFRDLILVSGLGYDPKIIKFTSQESYGIPGGINIPEDLRNFLRNEMGLFIQFLTPNYLDSRICLNEEGAGWCLLDDEKYFIPLLIPPNNHKLLSWIKTSNKGICIDDKGSLSNIYEDRKVFFGTNVNGTNLQQNIEKFVDYLKNQVV